MEFNIEKTPKVDKLLKTALQLFYKYGLKRVTVEEICQTAGVSKVTFYKNFKNKNELFAYVVLDMYEDGISQYEKVVASDMPFTEKIKKFIELKKQYTEAMSIEMMQDMYSHAPEEMRRAMEKRFAKGVQMNHDFFLSAQKKGEIRADINIDFITFMLNKFIEWAENDELLRMYKNPTELAMDSINFFFYGILGKPEEPETCSA